MTNPLSWCYRILLDWWNPWAKEYDREWGNNCLPCDVDNVYRFDACLLECPTCPFGARKREDEERLQTHCRAESCYLRSASDRAETQKICDLSMQTDQSSHNLLLSMELLSGEVGHRLVWFFKSWPAFGSIQSLTLSVHRHWLRLISMLCLITLYDPS